MQNFSSDKLLVVILILITTCMPIKTAHALGLDLGLYGSVGKLSDDTGTGPTVTSNTIGVYALPHVSLFGPLSIGAYAEYDRVSQYTDTAEVSGVNNAFSGYIAGGGAILNFGTIRLTGAYTLYGNATLEKRTSSGAEVTLKSPKGIHAILGYSISPKTTIDLAYAQVDFDMEVGTSASSVTRQWRDYRVGLSLHF